MMRYRIFFEKRTEACFVPHIVLPAIFSRSAARSGVHFQMTEGFSPHAKISFGPELAVGVVALCEPVDVWLENLNDSLFAAWNEKMPSGFALKNYQELASDAPSIGKTYPMSRCLIKSRIDKKMLENFLRNNEKILNCEEADDDFFEILFYNTTSIGMLVRALGAEWQNLCIVRKSLEGVS